MDKGLFANDGSFMERFKQMQQEMQEKEKAATAAASSAEAPMHANPKPGFAVGEQEAFRAQQGWPGRHGREAGLQPEEGQGRGCASFCGR